jgi:hypothetical protein
VTHNLHEQGRGKTGYIGCWNVVVHGCLIAWNRTPGWVGQNRAVDDFDAAYVSNGMSRVSKGTDSPALSEAPAGRPSAPADVRADVHGGVAVRVVFTDTGDNEIGYRIERRVDGGAAWTTVAYRPRQAEKHAHNPPAWIDFMAPRGVPVRYRVLAVGANDANDAASAPTAPLTL